MKKWKIYILTPKKEISKIQHLEIEPQIELMGEEIKTLKPKVDIEPLIFVHVEITELY
jgi:hypothetical protein